MRTDARVEPQTGARGAGRMAGPAPLAAALEFIHTNNSPNPVLALLSGRYEARVYASGTGSRIQLNRLPGHGMAPCNAGCVVCDLFTRGGGGILRIGRGADGNSRP